MKQRKVIIFSFLLLTFSFLSVKTTHAVPMQGFIVFSEAMPNPITAGEVLIIRGQGFGDEYVHRSDIHLDQNEGSTIAFYVGSQRPEPAIWIEDNSSAILWSDTEIQILLAEGIATTASYEVTGEITNFSKNIVNFPDKKLTMRFTFTIRPKPPPPLLFTVHFSATCGPNRQPFPGAYIVLEDVRRTTSLNTVRAFTDTNGKGTISHIIVPAGAMLAQQFDLVAGRVSGIPDPQPPRHRIELDNSPPWEISSFDFHYPQCPQLEANDITIYGVNGEFVPGGEIEVFALASQGDVTLWDPQEVMQLVGIRSSSQLSSGNFIQPIYAQETGIRVLNRDCPSVCQVKLPNDIVVGDYDIVVILQRAGSGEIIDTDARRIRITNEPELITAPGEAQQDRGGFFAPIGDFFASLYEGVEDALPILPDPPEEFEDEGEQEPSPQPEEEPTPDEEEPVPQDEEASDDCNPILGFFLFYDCPETPSEREEPQEQPEPTPSEEPTEDFLCNIPGLEWLPTCPDEEEPPPQEEQPPEEGFGDLLPPQKEVERIVIGDHVIYGDNLEAVPLHLDGIEGQAQDFAIPVEVHYNIGDPKFTRLYFNYLPDQPSEEQQPQSTTQECPASYTQCGATVGLEEFAETETILVTPVCDSEGTVIDYYKENLGELGECP